MTLKFKTTAFLAALIMAVPATAQDGDFDLSQQRNEEQLVNPVTGFVKDHGGIILNPTPQEMTVTDGSTVIPRKTITKTGQIFVKKYGLKDVEGAYYLKITPKSILIAARDEAGKFYARQTLEQLKKDGKYPLVTIKDWPDLPCRGVVEGFYGTPWSHEVRLSLIDFYGKFKMNTYVYGPKDDPYHSSPNWRLPYPEDEAQKIKELAQACNRNHVDFVWAIHPGQDIKWNEEDYVNLVNKFQMMYDLGVRSFAIFFDDISGEGTNPVRQVELLNRLNSEFIAAKGDVSPLIMCPTDYSKLWADPRPEGSLSIYGRTLDPSIRIFWTGDVVCSDLTAETMEWVNSRIQRPALYWWNFPVTDYVRHIVMEGPAYGLDTSLTSEEVAGVLSNPMEHGEASKLALYGVADYCWNVGGYNALDNWDRALSELAPEVKDAFRTFAIHSCDTETGYRRDESWETKTIGVSGWTQEEFDALMEEFRKIEKVPEEMAACKNELLMGELGPWLEEFGKLGTRGRRALELIAAYGKSDEGDFWKAYAENMMSAADRQAYEAHKSGTLKLQPFYENTMDVLGSMFYTDLAGEKSSRRVGIGSFGNVGTVLSKLMFDNDETTYYTSAYSQGPGDWIGADLGSVMPVWEVSILQGRNSVDDVDYFDHARLEYSADGKTWNPLIEEMTGQYDILWSGDPVQARYVRLLRLDSERKNWASVRSFDVNPVRAERLGIEITEGAIPQAMAAFDKNVTTSFVCSGTFSFTLPEGTEGLTILLKQTGKSLEINQMNAEGKVLTSQSSDRGFISVELNKEASLIEINGEAEIFEIIRF